jgi:hypothetical protein
MPDDGCGAASFYNAANDRYRRHLAPTGERNRCGLVPSLASGQVWLVMALTCQVSDLIYAEVAPASPTIGATQ